MQADWKLCPSCGPCPEASTSPPFGSAVEKLPAVESYALFRKTRTALLAPFEEIFLEFNEAAGGIKAVLRNIGIERLEHALQTGIDSLASELPIEGRLNHTIKGDLDLSPLRSSFAEWMEAKNAVEEENVPEGLLDRIKFGFTDPSVQQKSALGATIGSFIPGVGTVVGSVVGAFFGGHESGERHRMVVERLRTVAEYIRQSVGEAHPIILQNFLAEHSIELSRPPLEIQAGLVGLTANSEIIENEFGTDNPSLSKCEELARQCIGLLPDNGDCYAVLGVVLQTAGQYEAAVDAVRTAVELDPAELVHWTQMVGLLVVLSRNEELLTWVDRIAEYWPDKPLAHICLAEGYFQLGRYEAASKWAELALSAEPEDVNLILLRARIESRLQKLDKVAELLLRVTPLVTASIEDWRELLRDPDFSAATKVASIRGLLCKPINCADVAKLFLGSLVQTDAYLGNSVPPAKMMAARKTFLRGISDKESVVWFYDSTVFGSGSEGITLTNLHISWKELTKEPVTLAFANIIAVEMKGNAGVVLREESGQQICICADSLMAEALIRFLALVCAVEFL